MKDPNLRPPAAPAEVEAKRPPSSLLDALLERLQDWRPAFRQRRTWARAECTAWACYGARFDRPKPFCAARSVWRYRQNLEGQSAQQVQHLQGALDQMNSLRLRAA